MTKLQQELDRMTDPSPKREPRDLGCAVCGKKWGPHPKASVGIVVGDEEGSMRFPVHVECEPEWSKRGGTES